MNPIAAECLVAALDGRPLPRQAWHPIRHQLMSALPEERFRSFPGTLPRTIAKSRWPFEGWHTSSNFLQPLCQHDLRLKRPGANSVYELCNECGFF